MHPNPLGKQIGATFFHELPVPPPPPAPRVVVGAEAVRVFTLMMVMKMMVTMMMMTMMMTMTMMMITMIVWMVSMIDDAVYKLPFPLPRVIWAQAIKILRSR